MHAKHLSELAQRVKMLAEQASRRECDPRNPEWRDKDTCMSVSDLPIHALYTPSYMHRRKTKIKYSKNAKLLGCLNK